MGRTIWTDVERRRQAPEGEKSRQEWFGGEVARTWLQAVYKGSLVDGREGQTEIAALPSPLACHPKRTLTTNMMADELSMSLQPTIVYETSSSHICLSAYLPIYY